MPALERGGKRADARPVPAGRVSPQNTLLLSQGGFELVERELGTLLPPPARRARRRRRSAHGAAALRLEEAFALHHDADLVVQEAVGAPRHLLRV